MTKKIREADEMIRSHGIKRRNTQSIEAMEIDQQRIIKEAIGFRQFHLRGLENVNTEWILVTLAYNFKRLFSITNSGTLSSNQVKAVKNG